MSCSFEKILSDVKNLTQRLKSTDETTNKIIKNTSYFYVKLKSMNELQEKISILSNSCSISDNNDLSFEGNMENSNLEKLRQENHELRDLLKEYQTALELIMTRYRDDMNDFMHSSNAESQFNANMKPEVESQKNIEFDLTLKYVELYKIAIESTSNAEVNVERLEKSIESLHSENEMMRNILGLVDRHYGEMELVSCSPKPDRNCHDKPNHLVKSSDHLLDSSFSDDDRCSVSSDASVKTLI